MAEWHTGPYPHGVRAEIDHGRYQYTHMIRAPDDPERLSREERRRVHGPGVVTKWQKQHKRPVEEFREEIVAHMADGRQRTFNRIAVELYDYTADVAGPSMTKAVFDLVEEGLLEHTMDAPVYFRRRSRRATRPDWTPEAEPTKKPKRKVEAKAPKPKRKRKRKAKPKPSARAPARGFAEAVRASKGRREISPFEAAGKRKKNKTARQQRIMTAFERST